MSPILNNSNGGENREMRTFKPQFKHSPALPSNVNFSRKDERNKNVLTAKYFPTYEEIDDILFDPILPNDIDKRGRRNIKREVNKRRRKIILYITFSVFLAYIFFIGVVILILYYLDKNE